MVIRRSSIGRSCGALELGCEVMGLFFRVVGGVVVGVGVGVLFSRRITFSRKVGLRAWANCLCFLCKIDAEHS